VNLCFAVICFALTLMWAALTNPNGEQYPALINSLFNRSLRTYSSTADNRHDDYTFDNEHDDELQVWLTIVIQRLVQLFQRHGAVETYLPLLIPETTLLNAFPTPVQLKPAKLLDSTGKMTRLPSSDLLAMARSATRRQIERIKRYHVGRRYNEHPAGGQPSVAGELR
jgi:translation initiation factor 2-alpha kinase 4